MDRASIGSSNNKRTSSFSSLLTAVCTGIIGGMIISYAASMFFANSEMQTSNYLFKHVFKMDVNGFFSEAGDFTPGQSKSINPIVTLDATMDGFIVIVVEMPKFNRGGLYEIEDDNGSSTDSLDYWTKVEAWEVGDSWFEAYRYNDVLSAGTATRPLGTKITMRSMPNAQYGQKFADTDNLNVKMTAYACGSDQGETLETAWGTIKSHFNLGAE